MHHLPIGKLPQFTKRVVPQKRRPTQLRTQFFARDIHFPFDFQQTPGTYMDCQDGKKQDRVLKKKNVVRKCSF